MYTYFDMMGSYSRLYHLSWISFSVNLQENFTQRNTAVRCVLGGGGGVPGSVHECILTLI